VRPPVFSRSLIILLCDRPSVTHEETLKVYGGLSGSVAGEDGQRGTGDVMTTVGLTGYPEIVFLILRESFKETNDKCESVLL
jgi:hypothetical protein